MALNCLFNFVYALYTKVNVNIAVIIDYMVFVQYVIETLSLLGCLVRQMALNCLFYFVYALCINVIVNIAVIGERIKHSVVLV